MSNDIMDLFGFAGNVSKKDNVALVDVSYFAQRTFHGQYRNGEKVNHVSMRYTLLMTLLHRFKKLGIHPNTHEIILCYDGSNYWQKEYAPYYKCTRKKRNLDGKDWEGFRTYMETVRKELVNYYPFTIMKFDELLWYKTVKELDEHGLEIEVKHPHYNGVEADDVIGVLAKRFTREGKNVTVMTGDGDFTQLDYLDNLSIVDYDCKPIVAKNGCGTFDLIHKIVNGDTKDSVANIYSRSNYWENKLEHEKQKSAKALARKCCEVDDPLTILNEEETERYVENRFLKDFNYIPEDIVNNINIKYDGYERNKKSDLIKLMYDLEVNGEIIQENLKKLILEL